MSKTVAGVGTGRTGDVKAATTNDLGIWSAYDAWNASVEAEFFDGTWSGRPVYMDMENDVVARIADRVGAPDDPVEAWGKMLKPTLYLWPERDGRLVDLHARRLRRWRQEPGAEPPPCLALLAFFALAAEGMRGDEEFRSNNYYARLCELLGINRRRDQEAAKKVEQDFRHGSLELWNALNSWLLEHDGALGTPTAYSFDWRSYVGVPISQALLREEERLELRKLFLEFRLSPGQELATSDMLRLLKEWLPRADLPVTLKRLFEQPQAQTQIADIACVELQAWDGTPPPGVDSAMVDPSSALLIAAQVRRVPRPQLTLSLVVRGSSPVHEGFYELDRDAADPAIAAFREAGGKARLIGATGDGWRRVETDGVISFPDMLLASVRLDQEGGSARLMRKPRRLLILERDEEYRLAVEVDRVQLARENILIAHETLSADVDTLLGRCARDGFTRWESSELRGLSEGWVAWTEVELIEIPDIPESQADLSPLIPLEWTKIAIGGGVSLPGHGTWLRDAPPEVRATSVIDKEVTVTLAQTMSLAGADLRETELGTFRGAAVVPMKATDLDDGDYRVSLREAGRGGKPLVSSSFRIRSAEHPRLSVDLAGRLAYLRLNGALDAALTAELVETLTSPYIAGAAASPDLRLEEQAADIPRFLVGTPPLDLEAEADPTDAPTRAASGEVPSCLMGGAHVYELPDATREVMLRKRRPTMIDARCKNCGFEKWFPPHTRSARPRGTPATRSVIAVPVRTPGSGALKAHVAAITEGAAPGIELLLRAVTYAQGGSWSLFERLASQVGEEPWFALEAARTLACLGHIDMALDLKTGRPQLWSVSPPTLCMTPRGAILAGARSDALIQRLDEDVSALGGEIELIANEGAPATILVRGLDSEEVKQVAQSLSDAVGVDVLVNVNGASAIAAALPPLAEIERALPPLTWPAVTLERFDIARNKWERVPALDSTGAYKFVTRPLKYGFVASATGGVVSADNRLVKWLAGRASGQNLMAYDPDAQVLITRLGAQPPGLYERAVALCSGRPGVKRIDGTVTYEGVPPEIASTLYRLLCTREV